MVVEAFVYMFVLSSGASFGVMAVFFIAMKIYNRKRKTKNTSVIG